MMDSRIQALIDNASKEAKGLTVLNTVNELKEFYSLNAGKYSKWRAIASIEDWLPLDKEFLQGFRQQLSDNSVETRVIFKAAGLQYEKDLPNRSVKVVPDSYSFKSSVDILEDKILIMNPNQTILGLVIESETLVDVFIDTFDLLWNLLPETK